MHKRAAEPEQRDVQVRDDLGYNTRDGRQSIEQARFGLSCGTHAAPFAHRQVERSISMLKPNHACFPRKDASAAAARRRAQSKSVLQLLGCSLALMSLAACAQEVVSRSTASSPASAHAVASGMVQLTPEFPVVRGGVVMHQCGPVNFSSAFLAQQRAAFGHDPAEEFNRMTRYELGKVAHHEPMSAFGTVSETFTSAPDPAKIEFGQSSVTDLFGDGGKAATTHMVDIDGVAVKRGRPLADDVADLLSGALTTDDLPIQVFHYVDQDGDAHWVTENNRALTVLRMAKLLPTKIDLLKRSDLEKKQGANALLSVLNRFSAMPEAKPSPQMYIRIHGVNDIGEPRNSWDWDAPFGALVK